MSRYSDDCLPSQKGFSGKVNFSKKYQSKWPDTRKRKLPLPDDDLRQKRLNLIFRAGAAFVTLALGGYFMAHYISPARGTSQGAKISVSSQNNP